MRSIMAMVYLFTLALVTCAGTFLYLGAPINEHVVIIPFVGVGILMFDRLLSLCGVME